MFKFLATSNVKCKCKCYMNKKKCKIMKYTAFCGNKNADCAACVKSALSILFG
jgi:hypothetical protein